MENQTIMNTGIILVLIIGFTTVGLTDKDPTHYCESKEIKAFCYELSPTLKTCYTLPLKTGGKRCTDGWIKIPILEPDVEIDLKEYKGRRVICSTDGTCKEEKFIY